ncbi:MAG: hypothetical protein JNL69_08365 [Bacteroidia bacterium]|nr:hypothetical protein [Bacteroidia bacterium]
MKKDIITPQVEDIAVAVVKEENELAETIWNVYLINLKKHDIESVLITSQGYGLHNNEEVRTSTLRHFLDIVQAKSFSKIEPIVESLFGLSNEYWVSFYHNKIMYDKKYIFLPESIKEENFILVPYINKKGVIIK